MYGRVLEPRYVCDAGKYRTTVSFKILCETQQIATETFDSLTEAYGDATLSRTMVFKWHRAFQRGLRKC